MNEMNSYIEPDFEYQEGFQLMGGNSPCSLLAYGGLYNSSSSSTTSWYDECFTPSRRASSSVIDMDDLSFCQSFFGSNGSNSPVDDAMFYPKPNMNHNVKSEMPGLSPLYMTPGKNNSSHGSTVNCSSLRVAKPYEPCTPRACFDSSPNMSFSSLPSLLFDNSTSPLQMATSPSDFVTPSQTFLLEPYRPTTPIQDLSRTLLASPLASLSQPQPAIKYFMSPRDTKTQTLGSNLSFKSSSISHRSPSSRALESSAALHHIQSLGASRNPKVSKRPHVKAKIGRVPAGLFHCDFEGCKSEQKGFKRHEHLKRHQRTHTDNRQIKCQFCPKKFQVDRTDNYKSHVLLHTIPKECKRGSRTEYHPAAEDLYTLLCAKKRSSTNNSDGSEDQSSRITRKSRSSHKTSNNAR